MNEVVIKPSLREQFLQGWAQCRVIFFSAPCGFGKSTAATALLSNHKTCVFSAEDPEFLHEPVPKNVDAIVIDSLPALKDPEDQQTLCAWIRENPELHFVILSRGVLPGWLMPFRFTGLLQLIEARDLLFDRDTVRVFLEKNGCTPTEAEINVIIHDSLGYPLALTALSRLMQNGQPYTPEIVGIVQQEIYHYFEDNIFNRFSMPLRRMLLDIAPFDTFDAELAQMISGDSHINELISIVRHDTTMLLNADAQKYRFWSFSNSFSCGDSAKSIRRRSRPQCTAAPGFTMSCTKITSMRSSAIRAAKTTAASRKCSSATQSSTPVWDITMRWKSITMPSRKRRSSARHRSCAV